MKRLFFLIITILFSTFCFSQKIAKEKIKSARVFYKVSKKIPSGAMQKAQFNVIEDESIRETLIASLLKTREVSSVLEFKNTISYYVLSKEDLKEMNDKNFKGTNFSATLAASRNKYFVDLSSSEKFYQAKNMSMENELVYFEAPKWKLIDETKLILGYACKKALKVDQKKEKTYVWYTDEIPFGFGPKNYFGLSGLILEIEKGDDIFIANKIKINPEDIIIKKPKAVLKTSLKDKLKTFSSSVKEN